MQRLDFSYANQPISLFTHDPPDHLYNVISLQKSFYELDLLETCRRLYKPSTKIIDIGANIGNHTIYFAKILNAPVISFEPFPSTREILTENVRVNDCLQTVQIEDSALGDVRTVGKAILPKVRNYGMVSVRPDEDGDLKIALLDDFIFDDSAIGIIKLDVEGNELPVLRGAIKTIERHKPHIFIEIADEPELANFKEFLSAFGYGVKGRYCATPTYLFSPS